MGISALVLAIGLLVVIWLATRARELFVLSVREGRTLLVRGAIPISLRQGLSDVCARAGVKRATIRAMRSQGYARLEATGLDETTLQRARNVVGTFPFERLAAARPPAQRNLGQRLGVSWLSWLLTPRTHGTQKNRSHLRAVSRPSDAP